MNELTLSLLAIGSGLIVLLVIFNWWQERKIRKAADKHLEVPQQDLLIDDEDASESVTEQTIVTDNTEINLIDEVEFKIDVGDVAPELTVTHTESVLISENDEPISTFSDEITHQEAAVHEPEKTQQAQQHTPTKSLPHEVSVDADLVAVVHLSAASSGEHLRQFLMRIVNLDKPIAAYGLNEHQVWHSLTREQEAELFTKAVYSLQLADRAGPVSAETLQAFQKVMDEIAYELSAQVEYLGAADTLAFAQDLDTFCLEVDKTVSLHLVNGTSGRFTGTKFKGLAEANGLKLKEDGLFYSLSPDGNVLFSVVNVEKTPFTPDMLKVTALKGVTFQMEIARTPDCTEAFNRMAVMARSMASSLNSVLVDDHQRELPDAQIEKIRQQLKLIQVQMTVKGIPPGSPLALRLFS